MFARLFLLSVLAHALVACQSFPPMGPSNPPSSAQVEPPRTIAVTPRFAKTVDMLSAETIEQVWRGRTDVELIGHEVADANGFSQVGLKSLTIVLPNKRSDEDRVIVQMAELAAQGLYPVLLEVQCRSRAEQQRLSTAIKAAALATGGKNSVVLDYVIDPSKRNRLQITYK